MAVTFVAAGTLGAGQVTVTPGLPAGVQSGDLLLLHIEGEGEDANPDLAPTGWHYIGSVASSTDSAADRTRHSLYWRLYWGSDVERTVPDSGDHTLAAITAWRGVDPIHPIESVISGSSGTNANSHSTDASSTITNGAMVVCSVSHGDDGSTIATPCIDAGAFWNASLESVSDAFRYGSSAGTDGTIACAYGIDTTAGSVNAFAWWSTVPEERAWFVLALRPTQTYSDPQPIEHKLADSQTSTTSHTSYPLYESSPAAGDLAVAIFAHGTSAAASISGWTQVASSNGVTILAKLLSAAESGTVTVTLSGSSALGSSCFLYRNAHGVLSVEAVIGAGTVTASPDPPSISPSWGADEADVISGVGLFSSIQATAPSSGYTGHRYRQPVSGYGVYAQRKAITGSSEDPGTLTLDTLSQVSVFTIAVRVFVPGLVVMAPVAASTAVPAPTVVEGASGVTAEPVAVAAASAVPAPTAVPGAVTAVCAAVAATSAVPVPAAQPGARTALVDPVAASTAAPAPAAAPGAVQALPDAVPAASAVPAPQAQAGAVAALPAAVAVASSVAAPSASSAVQAEVAPVAVASAVPAPTATPGAVTASPAAVAASTAVPAPAASPGAVSALPDPVAASTAAVAPVAAPGAVSAQPGPVAVASAVPAPSTATAGTAEPVPVAAASVVPAPTVAVSAITASPSPVAAQSAVPAPGAAAGAVAATVAPVAVGSSVLGPSAQPGAVSAQASPVAAASQVPQPSALTAGAVAPVPVPVASVVAAPIAVPGAVTVSPAPVAASSTTPAPSVSSGIVAAALPVAAGSAVPAPTVFAGPVAAEVGPVLAVGGIPTPTALAGAVTALTGSVAAASAVPAPIAIAGDLIVPSIPLDAALPVRAESASLADGRHAAADLLSRSEAASIAGARQVAAALAEQRHTSARGD